MRSAWSERKREHDRSRSSQSRRTTSFHKIGGDGRLETETFVTLRMNEPEPPGMQHLTGKMSALAVQVVAENRMAELLEMHANLMRSTRVQPALDNAPSRNLAPHRPLRLCGATLRHHRHALPGHRVPPDREVAHAALRARPPRDQREINLGHFAPGKLRRERLVRPIVFCHHQTAAG